MKRDPKYSDPTVAVPRGTPARAADAIRAAAPWRRHVLTSALCAAGVVLSAVRSYPVVAQVSTLPPPTSSAGSLHGEFDVSATGAATYRIPIGVAPGRQDIEPRLALVYRSGSGDGHLGVGWSLEGLSQISRCGSNPARDGERRTISWDDDDNLCIDGDKLTLVSGTKQVDGAVYATDMESFRRIVGVGTPHQGFRVSLPDGRIATYGLTSECGSPCTALVPVHAPPNNLTQAYRAWNLASVNDRFGNWLRVEWGRRYPSSDPAVADGPAAATYTAEDYPVAIRYTGHNGTPVLSPQRTVTFTYADRADDSAGYTRGVHSMLTKRLTKITSTVIGAGTGTYREYRLSYRTSAASGRSLLGSVTECAGDGACHPATTFTWQETPRVFGDSVRETTPIVVGDGLTLQSRRKLGAGLMMVDVNGDGRDDMVYVKGTTLNNRTWRIALAYPTDGATLNGGAPTLPSCPVTTGTYRCEIDTGIAAPSDVSAQALDYDGDGRTDLLMVDNRADQPLTTWKILQSNGNGFTVVNTWVTDHPFTDGVSYDRSKRVHVADVDGDGRSDLLVCEPRLTSGNGQPWHLRRHTGSGWGSETLVPFFPTASTDCRNNQVMFLDVDGDGATDMLSGGYDGLYFAAGFAGPSITMSATSLRTIINGFWQGNATTFFTGARTADVNGDGLADVIADRDLPQSSGTMDVFLNTGAGFVPGNSEGYYGVLDQGMEPTLGQSARLDYDGDGRDDLLITNACPSGSVAATCANPRWMVLRATSNAPQLGTATLPVFARRELAGCPTGGGAGCIAHRTGSGSTNTWFGYQQTRVGDVNGDHLPDLVMVENDKAVIRRNQGLPATDHIIEIRDGLAWADVPTVRIVYKPTTDGSVLTTPLVTCAYPLSCARPNGYLVASHFADSGVGTTLQEFRYTYSEPRRDTLGGGFLGYRVTRITRVATGATTTTTYNAAEAYDRSGNRWWYPLARLPQRTESVYPLGGGRYRTVTTDHGYTTYLFNGARTRFVRPTQTTVVTREGSSSIPSANAILTQVTTQASFDAYGNPISTTVSTGVSTLQTAISFGNDATTWILARPTRTTVTSTVDGETQSRVTRRTFDPATGRVSTVDVESPARAKSTFGYDAVGNLVSASETDVALGTTRTTTSSYDGDVERMFVGEVINPLGHRTKYVYDRLHARIAKVTSPNDVAIGTLYDGFGRPQQRLRQGGARAMYAYARISDGAGRSHVETMSGYEGGTTLNTVHDRLGRPVRRERITASATLAVVDQSFDTLGRLVSRTIPYVPGETTPDDNWTYDGIDRVLTHTRADGSVTSTKYEGMTTRYTDARGKVKTTLVDAENQPIAVTDALGGVTRYEFGPFGGLRSVRDTAGNVIRTATDSRGHVRSIDDPDTGTRYYDYDAFGRRIGEKDALSRTITYEYDAIDRLTRRVDVDGTTRYVYDSASHGIGAMAQAISPAGHSESYAYDDASRLSAIVTSADGDTVTQKFDYDAYGRIATNALSPSGGDPFALYYKYADDGTLDELAESPTASALYEVTGRNARGQVTAETFRGRTTTTYAIDRRNGRTTAIQTVNPTAQPSLMQSQTYTYDAAGNIVERIDLVNGVSEKMSYDALERLERSSVCKATCTDRAMKYDAIGNVVAKWDIGEYTYDASRPHAVAKAGGTVYAYDAVGNQIARGAEVRKFNALDKLASLSPPGGVESRFDYDAFGRRVLAATGTVKSMHVADVFERMRTNGKTADRFTVKASGRSVAVLSRVDGKFGISYIHPDVLGSADLLTDPNGKIVADTAFDTFGRALVGDWAGAPAVLVGDADNDGYTGHRHDAASGLIDMGGRHYDPALARFVQADRYIQAPLRGESYNRYSYVFNNPLRYTDPSGYEGEERDIEFDAAYIYGGDNETDIEFDPAYVYGDADQDGGEGEGEGEYDDLDDGDRDDDYDGPGGPDPGFDDRDPPDDDLDGNDGPGIGDLVDAIGDAGDVLRRQVNGDSSDPEEQSEHAIKVIMASVAAVGAVTVVVIVVMKAVTDAGGAAGGALLGGAAAAGGSGAPALAAPPPPPVPEVPPGTFQPHNGLNVAESHFGRSLAKVAPDPGYFDVIIHGDAQGFSLPDGTPVSPADLARMITEDFRYNGEAIRLFSCDAGRDMGGAAQQLSNALGVQVKASAEVLQVVSDGTISTPDAVFDSSPANFEWLLYVPDVLR